MALDGRWMIWHESLHQAVAHLGSSYSIHDVQRQLAYPPLIAHVDAFVVRVRCTKLGYEVSGNLLGHHHKQTMFQAASTSHSSHCSIDDASARIWPQECGGAHPRQALDAQESLSRIARDAARRDNVYTAKHFCEWQVSS